MCEICLKLTVKTPEQRHWRRCGILLLFFNRFDTWLWCFNCYFHRKCVLVWSNIKWSNQSGKFYRRRNNSKVDSIETGRIVIADLLPWSNLESAYTPCFFNYDRILSSLLKACVRYILSNFYFSQNDSPSKTMKNVFYFI